MAAVPPDFEVGTASGGRIHSQQELAGGRNRHLDLTHLDLLWAEQVEATVGCW
jgi:hypothetical protein